MASKINKKYSANIKGIISITDGKIFVEVEDMESPIDLSEFASDFADKEDVKISFSYDEEIV